MVRFSRDMMIENAFLLRLFLLWVLDALAFTWVLLRGWETWWKSRILCLTSANNGG